MKAYEPLPAQSRKGEKNQWPTAEGPAPIQLTKDASESTRVWLCEGATSERPGEESDVSQEPDSGLGARSQYVPNRWRWRMARFGVLCYKSLRCGSKQRTVSNIIRACIESHTDGCRQRGRLRVKPLVLATLGYSEYVSCAGFGDGVSF